MITHVAADFGISESCLQNWFTQSDRGDGLRPGPTTTEQAELREAKKRIRLLEQENEVLRRAAHLSRAQLPGKMTYPLVRDLADGGVPVTVTCRVLKIARQPYNRWLAKPVTDAELDEAWWANAIFDAHRDDPEFDYRFLADEVRRSGLEVSDRVVWRICREMGWSSVFGKPKARLGGDSRPSRLCRQVR